MASPRSEAGSPVTSRPSMAISPSVTSSSPAMMRSKVDLPQPDGPTKTMNSPSAIARSTPWITATVPKALRTPLRVKPAMTIPSPSFHPRIGDSGGDEALQKDEDQGHRDQRNHRHRQEIIPLGLQLALEGVETDLQREGL